jgi:signal transduction histidine kinase
VTIAGEAEPLTAVKIAVYRIAQEAFNNIAKHAGASQVDVIVRLASGAVSLHVRDNGRGFDPAHVPGECMGLRIMAERAADVGARFSIASVPGQGTTVSMNWPTHAE